MEKGRTIFSLQRLIKQHFQAFHNYLQIKMLQENCYQTKTYEKSFSCKLSKKVKRYTECVRPSKRPTETIEIASKDE